ncbi:hypothetical protein ACFWWS_17280 [Streptomyces sp. NPDC059083]|uniref:hypothetical protein n=1 Tax=unclassified Streptomyces TaxID=2593676 RepID=UPI0036AB1228
MRGSFDDVPWSMLFPPLTPADVDSLNQAARTVDAACIGRDTTDWEWFPEHATFPGPRVGTPVILGLDVIEHADGVDQLEFLLQVVWTEAGGLAVDSAVNVTCWCDIDHATHDVDPIRLEIGEDSSLPEAFRTSAERLTSWLAHPHDADHWRARAGLPPR